MLSNTTLPCQPSFIDHIVSLQEDFIPKVVEQDAVINVAIGIAHINGHILICIGVGIPGCNRGRPMVLTCLLSWASSAVSVFAAALLLGVRPPFTRVYVPFPVTSLRS